MLTRSLLQGLRPSTIDGYSRAVRKTAAYFDACPGTLTKDQLKSYFSHLIETGSWSRVRIVRNGLQFYFKHIIDKAWVWVDIVKPPTVQTLPNILSQAEISPVLSAIRKLMWLLIERSSIKNIRFNPARAVFFQSEHPMRNQIRALKREVIPCPSLNLHR